MTSSRPSSGLRGTLITFYTFSVIKLKMREVKIAGTTQNQNSCRPSLWTELGVGHELLPHSRTASSCTESL